MIPVTDSREIQRITDLVTRHLAPHQPRDGSYELRVVSGGIQTEDDWIYVLVNPSRDDVRSYDYASRLAEAEQDLQDQENVRVLLVPAFTN